jgi:hypothetical protein
MDTQVLLDKLTKAVSFQFKEDKTSPGVTVSALKKGYYASVVRYTGAIAKGKVVVCSARGDTLDAALEGVAKEFLVKINSQPDPVQQLDSLVRSS